MNIKIITIGPGINKSKGESVTILNGIYAKISAPIKDNGGCLHKIKSMSFIKKNVVKKTNTTVNENGNTIVREANNPGELPPVGLMFL